MSFPVLGIDPGSRNTGVVLRRGEDLLAWGLAVRSGAGKLPDGHYLSEVRAECTRVLERGGVDVRDRASYVVGVEQVAWWPASEGGPPRNQYGLYGTAMVIGAVLARWPDAVVVQPGRGVAKLHEQAYPEPIRGRRGGKGTDRLVHVRAAFDHSWAAETLWNVQRRTIKDQEQT